MAKLRSEGIHITHRSVTRHPNTGKCRVTLFVRFREPELAYRAFDHLQDDQRLDEVSWN